MIGAAEGGLRLAGYGHDLEPLFVPAPQHREYLQANPRVVTRFFTEPSQAPSVSIETAYFRARKAPGTFRVFVQGESSAAGFPYGLGASPAGALEQRLERAFPEREIEVVSTAMAAVTSYALLDFCDEIIAQRPDAVVIYVGHNEYLGILGVGSTMRYSSHPWITRAFLAARPLRLFQWLASVYAGLRPRSPAAHAAADSLMARVAGTRSIPLGSGLYERGLEQFRDNLGELLDRYERAGIPVLIGTVVSNERDQPPLAVLSGDGDDAAAAAQHAWSSGREALRLGQYAQARTKLALARDLDPLRFRAPSEFNDLIRDVARTHGARLVDVAAAFSSASPDGIVGHELLLEHVHPNLDGYFLLADAFFDALVEGGLPGRPDVTVSEAQARAELPVSEIDRWLGDYKVRKIQGTWPFVTEAREFRLPPAVSEAERLAQALFRQQIDWPEAQDRLRRYDQAAGNTAEYAKLTTILADAFPFSGSLQFESAAALIAERRPHDALRYGRRGLAIDPQSVNLLLVTAHALLLLDRREAARPLLEHVLELAPGNATAADALRETGRPEP